jgi:hypothetical protein
MTVDVTDPRTPILLERVKAEEPSSSRIKIDAEGNLIISEEEHLATLSRTASVASGNKPVRQLEVSQLEGVFHWQDKL